MIERPILPGDLEIATAAANLRQDFAERTDLKSYGMAPVPRKQERLNHVVGCLGEWLCAQYFGLEFNPSVGIITNVDCKIIEVRARRSKSGRDLAIRPNDKMRLPHFLMWLDRERLMAMFVGWLCAWEGHMRAMEAKREADGKDVLWQPLKQVWFIPYGDLHSIKSLEDWIAVGHPEHWAPEQYRNGKFIA